MSSSRTRHRNRPQRGGGGGGDLADSVQDLVLGSVGDYAPSTEERITAAADLPGGKTHVVNPQSVPTPVAPKPKKPADYHKEHDVQPIDTKPYERPRIADVDDKTVAQREKSKQPPHHLDAIPVYQVERPGDERKIRKISASQITVIGSGGGAVGQSGQSLTRLANKDEDRLLVSLLNEDSTNGVRFSENEAALLEGRGALLPANQTSYLHLTHQGDLWAISAAAATVKISVLLQTEVAE